MTGDEERIARQFHETYERLAPEHGYTTREASAKPWKDVPQQNKNLMIAVVRELIANGVIAATPVPFTITFEEDDDGHTRLVTEYPDR